MSGLSGDMKETRQLLYKYGHPAHLLSTVLQLEEL